MKRNIDLWIGNYIKSRINRFFNVSKTSNKNLHILFCICDHFEPFWAKVNEETAYKRVKKWVDQYPVIASLHRDSLGNHPKHCFFYPEEEYRKDLLNMISEVCQNGFGEVEIHLHHDNDTSDNLFRILTEYKKKLVGEHGLLSKSRVTSDIMYGFIHGNWALDNSRPDGRWCGVNNELDVLQSTGCYADFTMPSAPSDTQTKTINSIYYAIDDPNMPKSHNTGKPSYSGLAGQDGLLCIQGPLCFNPYSRKFGIIPRIENGCFDSDIGISRERIKLWVDQRIHVRGRPDVLFIKLHTHGTQESNMNFFFDQGALDLLFSFLEEFCGKGGSNQLYYVSSRQMYNVVKGLEAEPGANPETLMDFELELQ